MSELIGKDGSHNGALEHSQEAVVFPSAEELEIPPPDPKNGFLRMVDLYDFLADKTALAGGVSRPDQFHHLYPGLTEFHTHGAPARSVNDARRELSTFLADNQKPVVVATRKGEDDVVLDYLTVSTTDVRKDPTAELFSHPENFGDEASPVRIAADLLFPRALAKRSSSRELLLEDFTAQYRIYHPDATTRTITTAFMNGIATLEKKLTKIDKAFQIPRSRGNNKDSIVKIIYKTPQPTIEQAVKDVPEAPPVTPVLKNPQDISEKEREETEDPIDVSVFGQSKTTLLQYLLNSGKPRSLEHIAIIRRKEGRSGPLQAAELADAKMVLSTLQLELPDGVELRNPDTTKFELHPGELTIQQIIELKKKGVEEARITREAEKQRIADENAAREAERIERFERLRTEALAAKAEREATESRPLPEPESNTEPLVLLQDAVTILLDILKDEGITIERESEEDGGKEIEEKKISEPQEELVVARVVEAEAEDPRIIELRNSGILDIIETATSSTNGAEPSLANAARIVIPEKRSRRDAPTRQVQMEPDVQQNVTPKQPEIPQKTDSSHEPEISFKNGKVEMSNAHLEIFSTLMSITENNGIKPRDLAQIITKGKARGDIIPATERRLEELIEAFKGTPIKITHPVDEFGVVDDRRFILDIPEGVNPLHYVSVRS